MLRNEASFGVAYSDQESWADFINQFTETGFKNAALLVLKAVRAADTMLLHGAVNSEKAQKVYDASPAILEATGDPSDQQAAINFILHIAQSAGVDTSAKPNYTHVEKPPVSQFRPIEPPEAEDLMSKTLVLPQWNAATHVINTDALKRLLTANQDTIVPGSSDEEK